MTPTIQCARCQSADATRPLAELHADATADAALRATSTRTPTRRPSTRTSSSAALISIFSSSLGTGANMVSTAPLCTDTRAS